ncbi:dTDP-4-dehydrorhamnose reductase [Kineococcus sp. R8]|uniref:dTDP-4-dehydrorhamnose reductase n=1 Tax=Kineococcus siccus TaxID=2696567 RepID=UPI0014133C05|nr:dTDP-4-dehydrorhamnose reductase [Kineococcus siccus]
MRWVVTGAAGLLGRDVVRVLSAAPGGADVVALARRDLDVVDADACAAAVAEADVVVNCAAYTAVDAAEADEDAAAAVNARGAGNLAVASAAAGARLVHVSTDYVFDGRASTPYRVSDATAPLSAYGRTKLAGERAVLAGNPDALVVRTSWLYGRHGPCFPKTMVRVGRERGALAVVDDQVGQPTWTADVARVLRDLVVRAAPPGTYHATAGGRASWFAFAGAVLGSAGLHDVVLRPVPSAEYPTAAVRPRFSVLDVDRLAEVGVSPPGDWRERWAAAAGTVLA